MEGWTDEAGWEQSEYESDDLSEYKESREEDSE